MSAERQVEHEATHPRPPGPPGSPRHTHEDGTTCMWVRRHSIDQWRSVDSTGGDLGPCPGFDKPATEKERGGYPHSDERCRQDSVDADGFRSLAQQMAKMIAGSYDPIVVPDSLSPDDGTKHHSTEWHTVPVVIDAGLAGRGIYTYAHDWSRVIVLRDPDQQVLLHEALHAFVDPIVPPAGEGDANRNSLNHQIINMIEVGLWESGWRRHG